MNKQFRTAAVQSHKREAKTRQQGEHPGQVYNEMVKTYDVHCEMKHGGERGSERYGGDRGCG